MNLWQKKIFCPTVKMPVFGAIFEVKSSIGKLGELLGHLDKKYSVDFNKYVYLLNNSICLLIRQ